MSISHRVREASHAETAREMDRRGEVIERLEADNATQAAEITRLRAEVEHWQRQAKAAQNNATLFQQDCAFHVAEKARKDAALKPFAAEADEWDDGHEYGEDQFIGMESEITVGDLRRARSALGDRS